MKQLIIFMKCKSQNIKHFKYKIYILTSSIFLLFFLCNCRTPSQKNNDYIYEAVTKIVGKDLGDKNKIYIFSSNDCLSCMDGFEKFIASDLSKNNGKLQLYGIFFTLTPYYNSRFDSLISKTKLEWHKTSDFELMNHIEKKIGGFFKPSLLVTQDHKIKELNKIYINEY